MRLLVTGANGLLAAAIVREFARDGAVDALDHQALDIVDEAAVCRALADLRPDVIVNCAAYNNVDVAQREPETALRVNAFGVLALARAAAPIGATLVHFSTDYVFDGKLGRPYREDDRPSPSGHYGASKLLGEWLALESGRAYVLRVANLFGEPGSNGTRRGSLWTIIDQIERGAEVPVFVDRTVSPTYTADIAQTVRAMVQRRAEPGLYHCVNDGVASWEAIALEIARLMNAPIRTRPMTLASASLAAPRPLYSALSPAKLAASGLPMPTWQSSLAAFLEEQRKIEPSRRPVR